jgi:glycosyltransferase involved in cell wall biosynthesis
VLKPFIDCAGAWADSIILLDDDSTDGSAAIAAQSERVKLLLRKKPPFDESLRRKTLIDEARKIPGRRLIFDLDADEMLSANWAATPEWRLMLEARPGTRFEFDWLELLPGLEQCAVFDKTVAFLDDGSDFIGLKKDSPKVPTTGGETIRLKDIKLLHYLYLDLERLFSRHRWYKCFELMENQKRPWEICVRYQDTSIKTYDAPIVPVEPAWVRGFDWLDQYRSTSNDQTAAYWWDAEVLNYFDRHGTRAFRKLNIWSVDWDRKAALLGRPGHYPDPRSVRERRVHRYIEAHREELKLKRTFRAKVIGRLAHLVLRHLGW